MAQISERSYVIWVEGRGQRVLGIREYVKTIHYKSSDINDG